jgi:hypothetical protein
VTRDPARWRGEREAIDDEPEAERNPLHRAARREFREQLLRLEHGEDVEHAPVAVLHEVRAEHDLVEDREAHQALRQRVEHAILEQRPGANDRAIVNGRPGPDVLFAIAWALRPP